MSDAVRMTQVPNLYVLPSGHIPPNPAELLGSTRYLEALDELRQQFDWVIIDAPPVMAVTDAAILSNSATGVVFVVGAEMTSRRNASAAVEHPMQAGQGEVHRRGAQPLRRFFKRHRCITTRHRRTIARTTRRRIRAAAGSQSPNRATSGRLIAGEDLPEFGAAFVSTADS